MLEEAKIVNFDSYNLGMKKSMLDKMFFVDKIDAEIVVDYGCANGVLVNFLHNFFPEIEYYGFDTSQEMINEAKRLNPEIADNFTTNWEELHGKISKSGKKAAVLLSSIIHEVYSYGTSTDVGVFWDRIFGNEFDYIIIRDMMPSKTVDRRSDINDIQKILKHADRKQLFDFETVWGSIENNKNLIHFFLKYRYNDNWDREVEENYLPINREKLLSSIPENYEITFHEHFVLPFLKTEVEKDFKIEIKDNTHLKLILKKF
jgi:SAM-dependent methyltransferase